MSKTVTLPIEEYNALVDAEALIVKKYSAKKKQAEEAEESAIETLNNAIKEIGNHTVLYDRPDTYNFNDSEFGGYLIRLSTTLSLMAERVTLGRNITLYDELMENNKDLVEELKCLKGRLEDSNKKLDDIKSLGFFGRLIKLFTGYEIDKGDDCEVKRVK